MQSLLRTLLLLLSLAACSEESAEPGQVFEEQVKTIDRAEAVEGLLQQSATERDRELEQQSH